MSPPIHIASLSTHLVLGGAETRLLSFARNLDPSRFRHTVISVMETDRDHDARFGPIANRYAAAGVDLINLGEQPWGGDGAGGSLRRVAAHALRLRRVVARLARLLRELRVDVVDAHIDSALLFGALAGRVAGVRAFVGTDYGAHFWKRPIFRALAQPALGMADALICDSHVRLNEMLALLHGRRPAGYVIPNGIPTPRCSPAARHLRAELRLPRGAGVRVIGQVSRMVPFKGHRLLLRAAPTILEHHPNTYFVLCGYPQRHPAYPDELRELAGSLGVADHVRILRYPGPIGDVWSIIDIHAHPTLKDSAPICITEAMALARPSVAADIGGISDMIAHEESGLVVPPGDVRALTNALNRLLDNPDLASRFGRRARALYERRHSPALMTAKIVDVIETALARPRIAA